MPVSVTERHHKTQSDELQRQYDTLTRRIAALDTDIGRELDSEHKLMLQERRAQLDIERSGVLEQLERTVQQPRLQATPQALQPNYAFPFLRPFNRGDQDIFFGREHEIEALVSRIQYQRTVVVNGLSGSGKSSLIKAGVVPRLEALGYEVVYVQVMQDIIGDILDELERHVDPEILTDDYVKGLDLLIESRDQPAAVVLIIDQFEKALDDDHKPGTLQAFFHGLSRLAGRVEQFVTIVLVVRADWLYYLETSVRRYYPDLNVPSCVFRVDPLTPEQARQAVTKPLEVRKIPYDAEIVEDIINNLRGTITGLAAVEFVHPLQLQMVLHALFQHAERRGVPQEAYTNENYRLAGSTHAILGDYIKSTVEPYPEAWRALARFLGPDRKSARTLHFSEAENSPEPEQIEADLEFLIRQGLIVTCKGERPGESVLRLSHDYLVGVIVDYLNGNPGKEAWWLAEGWLDTGTEEWLASKRRNDKEPMLLERSRYLRIFEHLKGQKVHDDAQKLLTLTTLSLGEPGLGHWLSAGGDQDGCIVEVIGTLLAENLTAQEQARQALRQGFKTEFIADAPQVATTADLLAHKLQTELSKPGRDRQDAAAQALWALGRFESKGQQLAVGARLVSLWLRTHTLQVASYALIALFVLAATAGVFWARERLRGSWQSLYSLRAGAIPLVVSDPADPSTLYAMTIGGPGPREGNSLFVQRAGRWTLLSRDFGRGWPTALVVARRGSTQGFWVALYGGGVLRSLDEGQSWQVANQGLPSHGITGIVVDPADPAVMYAATNDWRGVLRSIDAGDSWDLYDYDYDGEIYGVAISAMTYSPVEGGLLIVGTDDGRILVHRRNTAEWELVSSLSKGRITALAIVDESIAYAGTSRGIVFRSIDGGLTWNVLGQIPGEFNITALTGTPGMPEHLYARAYGNGGQKLWVSNDGGNNWQMLPADGLPRTTISSLLVSTQAANSLVAGGADGLFTSADGGNNWEKVPLNAPLASPWIIAMSPKRASPVYAAQSGSIYVNNGSLYAPSETNEDSWMLGKGLRAEIIRAIAVDPDDAQHAYAGVLLLGKWSVFITRDGGRTWQQTTPPPSELVVPDTMALVIGKRRDGAKVIYAGTVGCGVFRSTDEGASWDTLGRTRCSDVTTMPSDISLLAVDASGAEKVYAAMGQTLYASADGGRKWLTSTPDIDGPILGLASDPIQAGVLYLVAGSSGCWRSEDGGVAWTRLGEKAFGEADLSTVAAIPGAAGQLIVGSTNGGVWRSLDSGDTWHSIRENLAVGAVTAISVSEELGGRILISSAEDGMALFTPGRLFGASKNEGVGGSND